MPADTFWNRLRSGKPPTYEVLANGVVNGPLHFVQIKRGVLAGQFSLQDSYRRNGEIEWKSVGTALVRGRLFEAILFGSYAIFTLGLGVFAAWLFLKLIVLERESSSWPSVPGVITFSEVEHPSENRYEYMPHVGYTYRVGSKNYFGETIYPECCFKGRESWARSVISRYPTGNACRVFYFPRNPAVTMLEKGLAPHSFAAGGFGLMFCYTSVLFGCLSWSIWRTPVDKRPSREGAYRYLFFAITVVIGFIFVCWLP